MPSKKLYVSQQGFTLIEIIIYLVIFGIVGTVAASVFTSAIEAKVIVGQNSQLQIDMQRVMERIVDSIHSAKAIQTSSTTSIIRLEMADSAKNPTVITIGSTGNNMYPVTIQEGAGSAIRISPGTLSIYTTSFATYTNLSPSTSSVLIVLNGAYYTNNDYVTSTLYALRTVAMPLQ